MKRFILIMVSLSVAFLFPMPVSAINISGNVSIPQGLHISDFDGKLDISCPSNSPSLDYTYAMCNF